MDRTAADVSYEELMSQCPVEIKEALPQDRWRIDELWRLDLPVADVAVAALRWQLELPMWQYDGVRFQVRPVDVAADPQRYPHHYARVMAADVSYPIHGIHHRGRIAVLDGFHRLLKTQINGGESIPMMLLSRSDLLAISRLPEGPVEVRAPRPERLGQQPPQL